jgi:hypothetical protein
VDDALLVRVLECLGDLERHRQRLGERHRAPLEALRQVLAVHQLHGQERASPSAWKP